MQNYCSVGPLEWIFMALFEIAYFSILWSNLIAWGIRTFFYMMEQFVSMRYRDIFQFYGYVGPLECIFIAPLALSNEGVPGHFSIWWINILATIC